MLQGRPYFHGLISRATTLGNLVPVPALYSLINFPVTAAAADPAIPQQQVAQQEVVMAGSKVVRMIRLLRFSSFPGDGLICQNLSKRHEQVIAQSPSHNGSFLIVFNERDKRWQT